jgi:hypothetical protein
MDDQVAPVHLRKHQIYLCLLIIDIHQTHSEAYMFLAVVWHAQIIYNNYLNVDERYYEPMGFGSFYEI